MKRDINNYTFTADGGIVCGFKDRLRRSEPIECNGIDGSNYEEIFALYADGHDGSRLRDIDEFLSYNPQLKGQFENWRGIKLVPDVTVMFANKEMLKRRVLRLGTFYKVSAAASIVVVFGALLSIFNYDSKVQQTNNNNGLVAKYEAKQEQTMQEQLPVDNSVDVSNANVLNKKVQEVSGGIEKEVVVDETMSVTTTSNSSFIAKIEPIELQLDDMIDNELTESQMVAAIGSTTQDAIFVVNDSSTAMRKRPKNFVGKIFEGIAQIFKSADKDAIRYMALSAIGEEVKINTEQKQVTSSIGSPKSDGGFYIMGIYIVKKKAE